ncbi:hypothetical protein D3C81_884870 [compost metagenome]
MVSVTIFSFLVSIINSPPIIVAYMLSKLLFFYNISSNDYTSSASVPESFSIILSLYTIPKINNTTAIIEITIIEV